MDCPFACRAPSILPTRNAIGIVIGSTDISLSGTFKKRSRSIWRAVEFARSNPMRKLDDGDDRQRRFRVSHIGKHVFNHNREDFGQLVRLRSGWSSPERFPRRFSPTQAGEVARDADSTKTCTSEAKSGSIVAVDCAESESTISDSLRRFG